MGKSVVAAYVAAVMLWLTSCSPVPSDPSSIPAEVQNKANTVEQASDQESKPESSELQNAEERRLVQIFQFLLQMDKKEGLAITAQQAEQLLPLVRTCSNQGEMLVNDQNRVLELLNPAQKMWYQELQEKHRSRLEAFRALSEAERERMIQEYENKRKRELEQPKESAPDSEQTSVVSAYEGFTTKNIEQQLIELLEARR